MSRAERRDGVTDLLAAILRGTPKLRGALCIGRHTLFDLDGVEPGNRERIADEAASLCFRCPALHACSEYADTHRLTGVVAGHVVGETVKRTA